MAHWYSFILGRTPELSVAELEHVLPAHTDFSVIESSAHFFVIETPLPLDTARLMRTLGGTIKIGEGLEIFSIANYEMALRQASPSGLTERDGASARENASSIVPVPLGDTCREKTFHNPKIFNTRQMASKCAHLMVNHLAKKQKIYFGVSAYSRLPLHINPYALGLEIKKILKEAFNHSSRLVSSREGILSSVVVATNKLLSNRGAELQLFVIKKNIYVARTSAVQNFADFSKRDYERPAADSKSGMIPPKIARSMINLAQIQAGENILDPFCGSGTILMEAALLHPHHKLYGSDMSTRAIQDTKKNFNWLKREYPRAGTHLSLIQSPIETLDATLHPHSIDAIITEPFLGPPLRGATSKTALGRILNDLNPLYEKMLFIFSSLLKPRGRVVMVWPVFAYQKSWLDLPAFNTIKKYFDFEPLSPHAHGIFYARPDQKVGRYIVKLTLK
ncbi:MAG: methyltransferase domain-containing protein [Candidatus Magasanikbacteria bacterium]|nr:methyltransferase domain-containing protein [Candidatus Magasanikbacteria bacterium]